VRLTLRTMALAIGSTWIIGTSAAQAQTPPAYYYPAPGDYASAFGTVHIPAAGYSYNAAPYAVLAPRYRLPAPRYRASAPRYPAPTYTPAWGYGDTQYQGRYFYTGVPNWRVGNTPAVAPDSGHEDYWLFLR
jgi:hypothetical protein